MISALPPDGLVYCVRRWAGEYFSRDEPGRVIMPATRSTLWRISADGTARMPLTGPALRAEHPRVTRDGRWIYYQAEEGARWRIHRMRTDGTQVSQVAPADPSYSAFGACLSAEGGHFVWTRHDGHEGATMVSRSDGTASRQIAPELGYIYMAAPDACAQRVVFSGPGIGYRLGLAEAPAWRSRLLTPDLPQSYVPRFTPDGDRVVFIRRDGGLYVIGCDGGGCRQLVDGVQVEFFLSARDEHGSTDEPSLSPDGRRVAFIRRAAGRPPQVAVVPLDGGIVQTMTDLPGTCGRVRWSPDGRWLGLVSFVDARPQLFIMPENGGTPRQLTREAGAVVAFDWIPAA